MNEPSPENGYLSDHAKLLITSFHRVTGKPLVEHKFSGEAAYRALYEAPYGVVSHNTDNDPVFNYGNKSALNVFQMSWQKFTALPSRQSAEPVNRKERQQLLARVNEHGYIEGYRGIRISATGIRFWIEDTIVWSIVDDKGIYYGQAAVFYRWSAV